jgi:lysozyme family protein
MDNFMVTSEPESGSHLFARDRCFDLFISEEGEEFTWSTYQQNYAKYGVTQQMIDAYCTLVGMKEAPDVADVTEELARDIFAEVWAEMGCEQYPTGLAYFIFETAMLYGVGLTLQWMQLCHINKVASDPGMIVRGVELYRRRRDRSSPIWSGFGQAWTNRCNRSRGRALQMLAQPPENES